MTRGNVSPLSIVRALVSGVAPDARIALARDLLTEIEDPQFTHHIAEVARATADHVQRLARLAKQGGHRKLYARLPLLWRGWTTIGLAMRLVRLRFLPF